MAKNFQDEQSESGADDRATGLGVSHSKSKRIDRFQDSQSESGAHDKATGRGASHNANTRVDTFQDSQSESGAVPYGIVGIDPVEAAAPNVDEPDDVGKRPFKVIGHKTIWNGEIRQVGDVLDMTVEEAEGHMSRGMRLEKVDGSEN